MTFGSDFTNWDALGRRIVFQGTADRVPPVIVKIANRPAKGFAVRADPKLIAADFSELLEGNVALAQDRHRLFEIRGGGRNYNPRLRLVKENCSHVPAARFFLTARRAVATIKIDIDAKKLFGIEAAFCEGNSETALAAIVRAFDQALPNQIAHRVLNFDFVGKIDMWRRTFFAAMANFQELRTAQVVADFASENDRVAVIFEPLRCDVPLVID